MEAPDVEGCCGTYRVQQQLTPRQRRVVLRWMTGVAAIALMGWLGLRYLQDGWDGVVASLVYVAAGVAVNVAIGLAGRRGPLTRVEPAGLLVRTGLTGGRRSLTWDEVVSVQPPQRFNLYPTATVSDGSRVELPGLPVALAERLGGALAALRGTDVPPGPPPRAPRVEVDDGWDGPYRRGHHR